MNVRSAREEDLPATAAIFLDVMSQPPYGFSFTLERSAAYLARFLADGYVWLVAEEDGIAGFVIASFFDWDDGISGYVEEIHVRRDAQGRGIGSRLYADIEEEAKRRGCRKLILLTHEESDAARFYEGKGFSRTGYVQFAKQLK